VRVLWTGVAAWAPSGYGVAARHVVKGLQALGHEVVIFTYYGLHGGRVVHDGIEHWPIARQPFGSDVIMDYVREFQPDVVLTLYDQWVMPAYQILGSLWLPWVVLHCEPMEPKLRFAVRATWRQWAMCQWAAGVMRAEGMDPRVVPLGVDTRVYKPLVGSYDACGELVTKERLKARFGCPEDAFLVGIVAANKDYRKNLEAQVRVFAEFHRRHPDAWLFVKTNPTDEEGGWNVPYLVNRIFGLREGEEAPVLIPAEDSAPFSSTLMCELYNSFDVLLNASCSEGFGLPVLEAQACGTPVIVTDFSAMPEVGAVGFKVPCERFISPVYSYVGRPKEDKLLEALEEAYSLRGSAKWREMSLQAREHALKYDWQVIVRKADEELQSWLEDRPWT
jgi:glycosyltransferase involved in cell wall biosynthesis